MKPIEISESHATDKTVTVESDDESPEESGSQCTEYAFEAMKKYKEDNPELHESQFRLRNNTVDRQFLNFKDRSISQT